MELSDLKSKINISVIISKDINLKKHGKDLIGMCPFHNDTKPSLTVSDVKGIYKCFSCGAVGDVFDYLNHQRGMNLQQAKEYLGVSENHLSVIKKKTDYMDDWELISPIPQDYIKPDFNHKNLGEPVTTYEFKSIDGKILGYTARFEGDYGKNVLPLSYFKNKNTGEYKWFFKGLNIPRPLYGLNRTKNKNDIIIVEGEKCADVGHKIFKNTHAVVTWTGGINAVKNTDWTPLKNKNIIIWPDFDLQKYKIGHEREGELMDYNDQPGQMAALEIQKILPHAKILDIPRNKNKGWDIADAYELDEWKDYQFYDFIDQFNKNKVESYEENEIVQYEETYVNRDYFRFLGYDDSKYYFFLNTELQVVARSNTALSDILNILQLAPEEYWESYILDGGELKKDGIITVANYLMCTSRKFGIFDAEKIRGRGCWNDDGKYVIHVGNNLIVNGKKVQIPDFKSGYIYPASTYIKTDLSNPLKSSEANKFIGICERLIWERPIYATLLAGWCVVAPVCGALDWRPHIWITSKAGSGKSYVMDNIIRKIVGDFGIFVQGRTTEAGIRQSIKNDALPVLFDEAESENQKAGSTIENVLSLMRQASSETGGKIVKGTAGGKSLSFTVRSCFALSSIAVNLQHNSDISRVSVLTLLQDNSPYAQQKFEKLSEDIHNTLTREYCMNFQARTFKYIDVIRKNAVIFSDAAAKHLGSKRLGDQIGVLLAGAYLLYSSKLISKQAAEEWIASKDWSDEKIAKDETDEIALVNLIMSSFLRVNNGRTTLNRTVGELIDIARGESYAIDDDGIPPEITKKQAIDELARNGLRVEEACVIVSNSHEGVKNLLRNTKFNNNWSRILKRINGAESINQIKFKSVNTRAVSIPY